MKTRCRMELCTHWSGDGDVCPCAVFGMQPNTPDYGEIARIVDEAAVSPLLAERDRALALLAEIGYGEDGKHSWRCDEATVEHMAELVEARDEARKAYGAEVKRNLDVMADTQLALWLRAEAVWRATQAEAILSLYAGQENYAGTPAFKVMNDLAATRARVAALEEFYGEVRALQVTAAVRGQTYHAKAQQAGELPERIALLNQGYEAFDFNVLLKQLLARFEHVGPVELTDDEARAALEDDRGVATQPAGDVDTNRFPAGGGEQVSISATQPVEPPHPEPAVRTLHVTTMRDIPEGHTDQRVRYVGMLQLAVGLEMQQVTEASMDLFLADRDRWGHCHDEAERLRTTESSARPCRAPGGKLAYSGAQESAPGCGVMKPTQARRTVAATTARRASASATTLRPMTPRMWPARKTTVAIRTQCQTPGAQYHVHVTGDRIVAEVDLPVPLALTEDQAVTLERNVHNALELVLAPHFTASGVASERGGGE